MREKKWTSGAWSVIKAGHARMVYGENGERICKALFPDLDGEDCLSDREANAHLISAAPDLVEALEMIIKQLMFARNEISDKAHRDHIIWKISEAEEALAKAYGEV